MADEKKKTKKKKVASTKSSEKILDGGDDLKKPADLKNYLLAIRDKLSEDAAAPIHAVSAMNSIMNLPNVYDLLNEENKEIARDIWLRIKQGGMQLRNPPLLFSQEEGAGVEG